MKLAKLKQQSTERVMPVVGSQIWEICPYITLDRPFDTGTTGTQKNLAPRRDRERKIT